MGSRRTHHAIVCATRYLKPASWFPRLGRPAEHRDGALRLLRGRVPRRRDPLVVVARVAALLLPRPARSQVARIAL